jgi:hypothetical protein
MVWVYSRTGYVVSLARKLIIAGNQVPSGEQVFTSSGTWTAPQGVYSVSVVCIGNGGAGAQFTTGGVTYPYNGGGGGGLGYKNNISVIPFQDYTVVVSGGSYFINTSTVYGFSGGNATVNFVGTGGSFVGDGGFDGGDGGAYSGGLSNRVAGGGGSAADYDADGADGSTGSGPGSGTGISGNNVGDFGGGGQGASGGQGGVVQIRWGTGKDFP